MRNGAISEIDSNLKFDFGRFLPSKSLIQANLIRLLTYLELKHLNKTKNLTAVNNQGADL
ncbi:hypothetical protein BpHYR1_001159 [Brachionus plicatilis]|uniref:Uncharacterized protein n=1 Tax=Brachionus plicatilis TaxID=10195 RepID=A0A3M7RKF9_BRAPC|nr:hypothetical protein BpHYR1_001159 [Brachionus plicatilis]